MERKLQRIGNSLGVVLDRTMREHLGVDDSGAIDVSMVENAIIIRARHRQSFEDALSATFNQYDNTLQKLAE